MDIIFPLICLAIFGLVVASLWVLFTKAGEPGWASIIPIFNLYILLKIAGKPAWWLILYFIPIVSLVVSVLVLVDFAKAFGKGAGYAIGMLFLPFIFFQMLAFGDGAYLGNSKPLPPPLQ